MKANPDAFETRPSESVQVDHGFLAAAEEHAGEDRLQECGPTPAGAVEDQDRVRNVPIRVALGRAQRAVVQTQPGQCFARLEAKIVRDVVAFHGRQSHGLLRVPNAVRAGRLILLRLGRCRHRHGEQ